MVIMSHKNDLREYMSSFVADSALGNMDGMTMFMNKPCGESIDRCRELYLSLPSCVELEYSVLRIADDPLVHVQFRKIAFALLHQRIQGGTKGRLYSRTRHDIERRILDISQGNEGCLDALYDDIRADLISVPDSQTDIQAAMKRIENARLSRRDESNGYPQHMRMPYPQQWIDPPRHTIDTTIRTWPRTFTGGTRQQQQHVDVTKSHMPNTMERVAWEGARSSLASRINEIGHVCSENLEKHGRLLDGLQIQLLAQLCDVALTEEGPVPAFIKLRMLSDSASVKQALDAFVQRVWTECM
jgi:hypothetical protein